MSLLSLLSNGRGCNPLFFCMTNVLSKRFFSFLLVCLVAFTCIISIVPSAFALDFFDVVVSDGTYESPNQVNAGYILYYVKGSGGIVDDVPISIDWLLEHPDKWIDVYCTEDFNFVSYPRSYGPWASNQGKKAVRLSANEVTQWWGDRFDQMDTSRPIYLCIYNNGYENPSGSFTIKSNISYKPSFMEKLLLLFSSVMSTITNTMSSLLSWVSSNSLLMFILVGIPAVSLIVYWITKIRS